MDKYIITSRGKMLIHGIPDPATYSSEEWYTICPICTPSRKPEHQKEKKLSFNVKNPKLPWRCKHCQEAGYAIDEKELFKPKIKLMEKIPKFDPVVNMNIISYYEKVRKISSKTLEFAGVTCIEKNMFQGKTVKGEEHLKDKIIKKLCIAYKYLVDNQLVTVKYRDRNKNFQFEKSTVLTLYNIDNIKNSSEAYIVEGEDDALSYIESGIINVVSVPNGSSVSIAEIDHYKKTGKMNFTHKLNLNYLDHHIEDFQNKKIIYIATDDDLAGIKLRNELARRLGKQRCKFIPFSYFKKSDGTPCKDANDVLVHKGPETLKKSKDFALDFPIEGIITPKSLWNELEVEYDEGLPKGLTTGYKKLDSHLTWVPGWLYLFNGYPAQGKSYIVYNLMVINSFLYGTIWSLFCPENYPEKRLVETLASIASGFSIDLGLPNRITKEKYKKIIYDFVDKHFKIITDEKRYTPLQMREIQGEMIAKYGISGTVVDPWKTLKHKKRHGDGIDEYLSDVLADEVNFTTKNKLIRIIVNHPPTPIRDKNKEYSAPSPFEMVGGQIWFATTYFFVTVHRLHPNSYDNTDVEIHIQKSKDHKIGGLPTPKDNPIILKFNRLTGRFLENSDPNDLSSPYTRFPIKDVFSEENKKIYFNGF